MASKGQKFKKVPLELRLEAVKGYLNERKSYRYLGKKYNVSWKTVQSWVRIYKRDGGLDIGKKGRSTKDIDTNYKEKYEILKKFQDYLEEVDQEKK
jgi:transposase